MRKKEYSRDLATVVKRFLEEDEWHYSFDEGCIFRLIGAMIPL